MPRLIVIKGADEGKQFELTSGSTGVGRESSNRIRLHDTEVSRRHAEFVQVQEGYRLVDVGSANGTFVNSQSIRDVLLRSGDHIQIGQTVLVYADGSNDAPPAPSREVADQISIIARQDLEPSAIIKTVGETEGSRILAHPERVEGPWLRNALANLMYQTTLAVSHILDINQLLNRILDLIFRSLDADRGCIMLQRTGPAEESTAATLMGAELEPAALRWRDGIAPQERTLISRTVIDYVLREKKGILVSDAAQDERFQAVQSIVRWGIREIICVPMKGRHETLGVLYLDTRTRPREALAALSMTKRATKLTGDHLALASAIAHQAALAVEETRYYQAMVQAERLAAVGQTIASLSHHIKNILQGLRSGSDIIKMGLKDMDPVLLQQGWRNIEKNQGKIYDLVMDMLSYSKEREPTIEATDVNGVVDEVIELLAPRAQERGVKLGARLDRSMGPVPADREGIHRALLNLVGNALDAVEESGNPKVLVSTVLEEGGQWVRIEVRDNGAGIPEDKMGEIFRPFVSTKGSRGTGLGLAVSRKILREHGGDILVESLPGKGSLFLLRLPMRSPMAADASSRTSEHIPVPPEPN